MPAIGKPQQFSLKGPGGTEHPFKLQAGDHIGVRAVTVFFKCRIGDPTKTGSHNHRPDVQFTFLSLLVKIDSPGLTDRKANHAGPVFEVHTCLRINKITGRHCLGIINMNRPGQGQALVVTIHQVPGTVLGTHPASRAFFRDNITRAHPHPGRKCPRLAVEGKEIGVTQKLDVGRPTGLDQNRRKYSE